MQFGDYEKIDTIGHGASGYVYKVKKDGMYYALKACTGFDSESLRRFEREIHIAQRLNHPNIVTVYDYDMAASNPYFVMELCDGPIAHVIKNKSFEDLLDLSIQICEGVKSLHAKKILHRDIKPDNILVKNGTVKITDFSFGFFLDHASQTLTTSSQVIGTTGYIAPEIYGQGGHHASVLSDIYSIGCTLCYIFSGGIAPNYYNPQSVDPRITYVLEKCREIDPARRYATIQELQDELCVLKQPAKYFSINSLMANKGTLSKAEIRSNAFVLLMKNTRWDELIADIRLLDSVDVEDIIQNEPNAASQLLLLLENIYHNDTDNWKQFEDVDTFTSLCAKIFNNTSNVLTKEKAIDLTLAFSINYNRWPAMRIIRDKMLNKLSDEEIQQMSGYLYSHRESLQTLEDSIGGGLSKAVRTMAGLT